MAIWEAGSETMVFCWMLGCWLGSMNFKFLVHRKQGFQRPKQKYEPTILIELRIFRTLKFTFDHH